MSSRFSACGSLFHPSRWKMPRSKPQRLKPNICRQHIGTTEVVPFPNAGEN
jgi:hypothetical protein